MIWVVIYPTINLNILLFGTALKELVLQFEHLF
jgi:hypothetical protein